MSASAELERRYRRLLSLYPKPFREEREQEMLAVLMAGAEPGQSRPAVSESADLLGNALRMRLRYVGPASPFSVKHASVIIWVRLLTAFWLMILTGILCQYGRWWGLGLVPFVVLHFYWAYRTDQAAKAQRGRRPPFRPPPVAGA